MSKIINNTLVYKKVIQGEPNELTIEPSKEEQVYTPSENELLTKVTVKGYTPQVKDLTITPTTSEQVFEVPSDKDGFGTITVEGFNGEFEPKLNQLINGTLTEVTAEDIAVGDDIVNIRNYAFYGLTNLKKATLPLQTLNIGDYAFNGCTGLTEINLPNNLATIGNYAFSGCSGLNMDLDFRNNTGTITLNQYCFNKCTGLRNIYISKKTIFGYGQIFANCTGLQLVKFEEGFNTTRDTNSTFNSSKAKYLIIPSTLTNLYNITGGFTIENLIIKAETPPTIPHSNRLDYVSIVFVPTPNAYKTATNWSAKASKYYPLVNTYEDLASVDTINYKFACVKGNEEYIVYQFIDGQWYEVV